MSVVNADSEQIRSLSQALSRFVDEIDLAKANVRSALGIAQNGWNDGIYAQVHDEVQELLGHIEVKEEVEAIVSHIERRAEHLDEYSTI